MTTAELVAFLKLRLGLTSAITDERLSGNELGFCSHGRDLLRLELALAAPLAVVEVVTLEQDGSVKTRWKFPAATADAVYVSRPREITTRQVLSPANKLDFDHGTYLWETPRQLRVTTGFTPTGGLEVDAVLQQVAIVDGGAIGVPTPCHRAVGLAAAMLFLTANEDSDARSATKLFEAELDRLERLYSQYDEARGLELREAFLESAGQLHGDTIY